MDAAATLKQTLFGPLGGLKIMNFGEGAAKSPGQDLSAALAPSVFGLAAEYEDASSEKDQLPSLRLTISGSRAVILARTSDLINFYQGRKELPASFRLKNLWVLMRSMTAAVFTEYVKEKPMWHATVGEHDLLFLPAGMTSLERVPITHTMGIRFGLILQEDDQADNIAKVAQAHSLPRMPLLEEYIALAAPPAPEAPIAPAPLPGGADSAPAGEHTAEAAAGNA